MTMRFTETEFEMVERHVHDGKLHVARQQSIVAAFREAPERLAERTLELAERTLTSLEEMQSEHEAHLDRLKAELLARQAATTT